MKKYGFLSINIILLLWSIALISQSIYASFITDTRGHVSGRLSTVNLERSFNSAYVGELLLGKTAVLLSARKISRLIPSFPTHGNFVLMRIVMTRSKRLSAEMLSLNSKHLKVMLCCHVLLLMNYSRYIQLTTNKHWSKHN